MLSLDKLYTTNKEVAEILVSIPPHKATGDDGISAKPLRIAAISISNSLRRLHDRPLYGYCDFPFQMENR